MAAAGTNMGDRHRIEAVDSSVHSLLSPRTVALIGASERSGSLGIAMARMAGFGGFGGAAFPVNPQYREVAGLPAFAGLDDLPTRADHVVIGVGNERLEDAVAAAARHGAAAATIFASCNSPADPGLKDRPASIARNARMALGDGNCMAFYNKAIGLRIAGFPAFQARH